MTRAARALVPKLRFPKFRNSGSWTSRKLRDVVSRSTETFDPQNSFETPLLIDLENIESGTGRLLGVAQLAERSSLKTKFRAGDVLFGKLRPYLRKFARPDFHGVSTSEVWVLRGRQISNAFLLHVVQTERFGRLANISSGSRMPRADWNILADADFEIPNPDEQQEIADCLSSVDDLITVEERKLEALLQHKQGLMQDLFPRPGKTLPRLRFPEFHGAGEWEEKRLRDLGTLISGLTYRPKDVRDNGLLVLRSSNIQNSEIILDDCVYVRYDINGANLTQPNDILICVRNGSRSLIGKNAIVPKGMPVCTHGAFMTIFRALCPQFARSLLQTTAFYEQVSADLGATINSINRSQLLKYRFVVPKPAEQQKIAGCLSALDDLISRQGGKLEALRRQKQGLMQQLFPSLHHQYSMSTER